MDLSELAPGLQTLPDTVGSVRAAFADGDLTSLADPSRVDSYVPLVVVGLFVYLTSCLLFRSARLRLFPERPAGRRGKDDDDQIVRADNSPWLQQVWWSMAPPADLMQVDGLVIDRTGQRSHTLW